MDWTGLGLRDRVIAWLEAAAKARYAQDRRLDPFATSMRDFDDASAHLKSIRGGNPPTTNDPGQRIADLKKAGLVASSGEALTDLGSAVLDAWERFGVDSDAKTDVSDIMQSKPGARGATLELAQKRKIATLPQRTIGKTMRVFLASALARPI